MDEQYFFQHDNLNPNSSRQATSKVELKLEHLAHSASSLDLSFSVRLFLGSIAYFLRGNYFFFFF